MSEGRHATTQPKHTELPKTQMYPSPFPYGFHFPLVLSVRLHRRSSRKITHLDADRDIREDTQVDLGALDDFYFALYDFLGRGKLFCRETDTLAFNPNSPVSVCERGAFD
jgi:hypothetical protein